MRTTRGKKKGGGGQRGGTESRDQAIRSALHKAVRGTPLALFRHLTPEGDTASERLNAELADGTTVVFERRTTAVQRTEALRRAKDGSIKPLKDGEYRLKDGAVFQVVAGQIDFDAVLKDPDGVEPFRQYGAWREIVAIENPLLWLSNPLALTDVVRFMASDGRSYYAVQLGLNKPYEAYVVVDRGLKRLANGWYPLPGGRRFRVASGNVHKDSLADLKTYAYESTRLPR